MAKSSVIANHVAVMLFVSMGKKREDVKNAVGDSYVNTEKA